MNNKGQVDVGTIIMLLMVVVIAAVFIIQIAATESQVSDIQTRTNQSTDLTAVTCLNWSDGVGHEINESYSGCNITADTWYSYGDYRVNTSDCYLTSVIVQDSSYGVLTVDTDYEVFDSTGIIRLLNTTDTDDGAMNTTYITYGWCAEGYNTGSGSRGIAGLWTLFSVFALLAAATYGIREWINRR